MSFNTLVGGYGKGLRAPSAHLICVLYQVSRTAQSVVLLVNIKQALFSELDVEQFLTPKAAFDLAAEQVDMEFRTETHGGGEDC